MKRAALLVLLTACGGSAPSTPATPATPSGADAKPAAPATGRCLATLAKKRPAGWEDAGSLSVTVADEKPTRIAVKDKSGKVLSDDPVAPQNPNEARRLLRDAVCKAGGVIGVLEGKPPRNGAAPIAVVKPAKEDEAADVALLCSEPTGMPDGVDESQKIRIAIEMYEEQLSSTKWRAWLTDMTEELHRADDASRPSIKKKHGGELEAAKGAKPGCWLAAGLRK